MSRANRSTLGRDAPLSLDRGTMGDVLKDRVALITGASRGIGAGIAQRFAAEGGAVALIARTLEPMTGPLAGSLRETVAAIEATGGRAIAISANLADETDRARIVPEVERTLGPIDVLINNAAAAYYLPNAEIPHRRRRLIFEINVEAPMDLAQAVLPSMRASGRGWIVNISSGAVNHPVGPPYELDSALGFTTGTYGASKAALERLTTALAAELYPEGIAVNSLAPAAAVRTPGAEEHVAEMLESNPEAVEPLELFVEATLALATCDATTMTGRRLESVALLTELDREYVNLDGSPRS